MTANAFGRADLHADQFDPAEASDDRGFLDSSRAGPKAWLGGRNSLTLGQTFIATG
jgi:hypothetical protein